MLAGSGALQQFEDVPAVPAAGGVVERRAAVPVLGVHGLRETLRQVPDHACGDERQSAEKTPYKEIVNWEGR